MAEPTYRVLTWDYERQAFTHDIRIRKVSMTLWEVRKVLRWLYACGYDIKRYGNCRDGHYSDAPSVLVERIGGRR